MGLIGANVSCEQQGSGANLAAEDTACRLTLKHVLRAEE